MAGNYRYILGVDMGVASIGTALVRCSEEGEPLGILDAGVRLFTTPAGGAERRAARQARKTIRRRRQRLHNLAALLRRHGLFPEDDADREEMKGRSLYRLLARAGRGRLQSAFDVGRCLMHLAGHRGAGFLGQMEESGDGETPKKDDRQKTANQYRSLEKRLREANMTLGEFFLERLRRAAETKGRLRRRKNFINDGSVDFAVPRFLVKAEFRRIWEVQSKFFPQMTSELEEEAFSITFKDRPHAPYAVGLCSLDPDSGEPRLPRMSRLADTRRIYEQANNIRLRTAQAVLEPDRQMRDAVVTRCMAGETLTKTAVKKLLQPFCPEKILAVNMEEGSSIRGFCLAEAFADILSWQAMSEQEQDNLVAFMAEPRLEPEREDSPLMPEELFLKECAGRLGLFGPDAEEKVSRCLHALPADRSMLGETATRRILEKLREGRVVEESGKTVWRPLSQREAADACGYTAEEERARGMAGAYDRLPYYGEVLRSDVAPVHPWHLRQADAEEARWGRFPNPVVHVALNQLRKVVNEIMELYGRPMSVHVELAREFGLSAAKRKELDGERVKRRRENEEIDRTLMEAGLPATRRNRIKYRLWKEQAGQDIYTLDPIALTDFPSCDIDHIIPQSMGGSDTFANLALTFRSSNLAKGDGSAYEFIHSRCPEAWPHVLAFISRDAYPKNKQWRFLEGAKERFAEGDADATDSRLSDTGYMAKMAARYLRTICADVVPLRGGMTAYFRHVWGLDGLEYELMGENVRRELYDEATGEVMTDAFGRPKRNPAWKAKPRIDHRHHAEDALVLACVSRSMMQKLARASHAGRECGEFPAPFGGTEADFRRTVLAALAGVRPSPKAEHALEGSLHEDTRYRVLAPAAGKPGLFLVTYRRKIDALKKPEDIKTDFHRYGDLPETAAMAENNRQKRLAVESRMERAKNMLEEKRRASGTGGPVAESRIFQAAAALARKEVRGFGFTWQDVTTLSLVNVNLRQRSGFRPGGNAFVDFFEKPDGSVGWECVARFNAVQKNFMPEWQKEGGRLIWRLFKGDVLEMSFSEKERQTLGLPSGEGGRWFVVQKFSDNQIQVRRLQDARPLSEKDGEAACWVSGGRGLVFYTRAQARKVELSPFGKVLHKHRKLWDGKKAKKA